MLISLRRICLLNRVVPQGSVLDPLLFLLFIHDIARALVPGVRHIVYADDLQMYVQDHIGDVQNLLSKLSRGTELIAFWVETNSLMLNAGET